MSVPQKCIYSSILYILVKTKEPTKWSDVVIEDDEDDEDPLSV